MNQNMFSLRGKIALVTGASSGIGHCIAKGLAAAGATVVAAARRTERLQTLVAEIEASGGQAIAITMDVSERSSVNKAFDVAQTQLGIMDIIINNAGVADTNNFLNIDDASRDFVMNTNFNGVWNVAQEGSQRLVAAKQSGCIINIASVLGLNAKPGQSVYCASKGAVIQLTRSLALDLMKHNIRVNAVAPGWFKTEINQDYFNTEAGNAYVQQMPARRLGQLEELLGPIIMLASDAGSFVNGAVIPIDGALHARSL